MSSTLKSFKEKRIIKNDFEDMLHRLTAYRLYRRF